MAILGLRALYFCLSGLLTRFHYLGKGLAVLLGFIGVKMLLQAASKYVDGVPTIPTGSLARRHRRRARRRHRAVAAAAAGARRDTGQAAGR